MVKFVVGWLEEKTALIGKANAFRGFGHSAKKSVGALPPCRNQTIAVYVRLTAESYKRDDAENHNNLNYM